MAKRCGKRSNLGTAGPPSPGGYGGVLNSKALLAIATVSLACCNDDADDDGKCCCQFITEGDIMVEDLVDEHTCVNDKDQGKCITVDPNRLTPHPCCPDATGPRCGD